MPHNFTFYLHTINLYVSHLIICKGKCKSVPVRAMKAYDGMEIQFHWFLTSAVDGGEWSVSRLSPIQSNWYLLNDTIISLHWDYLMLCIEWIRLRQTTCFLDIYNTCVQYDFLSCRLFLVTAHWRPVRRKIQVMQQVCQVFGLSKWGLMLLTYISV